MERIILFCTLILIATTGFAAKHLDNGSHSWDGISGYEPGEVGASGGGG